MLKAKVEAKKAKRDKKSKKRNFALFVPFCLFCFAFLNLQRAESQSNSQNGAPQNDTARAKELIKLARAAIGGEEALSGIQTLSATGKYKRFVKYLSVQSPKKVEEKRTALPGKMEFEFALPDKFRRRVTGERLRGFGYSFAQVVNGEQAWRDPPTGPISSHSDRRVIDVGDVEEIQPVVLVEAASFFNRRFMQETFARAERKARANPPQPYEIVIRFSDRRLVNGAMLPFRITTTLNGEVIEEMTISTFEINRPINLKKFAGPPVPRD